MYFHNLNENETYYPITSFNSELIGVGNSNRHKWVKTSSFLTKYDLMPFAFCSNGFLLFKGEIVAYNALHRSYLGIDTWVSHSHTHIRFVVLMFSCKYIMFCINGPVMSSDIATHFD